MKHSFAINYLLELIEDLERAYTFNEEALQSYEKKVEQCNDKMLEINFDIKRVRLAIQELQKEVTVE